MEIVDQAEQDWFQPGGKPPREPEPPREPASEPTPVAAVSEPKRDDPSVDGQLKASDTVPSVFDVARTEAMPAAKSEKPGMDHPASRQAALYGHEARDALAEHMALMERLDAERQEIDDQLETASVMDGLSLIQKKRLRSDQLDWLKSKLPSLERAAKDEATGETKAVVNASWAPLATARQALLASIETKAEEIGSLMSELISLTSQQLRVIDLARGIDPQQVGFWTVATNGSIAHVREWIISALHLLDHRPDIRAQLSPRATIDEHEGLTCRNRLY